MNTPKILLYLILIVCGVTCFYSYKAIEKVDQLIEELSKEEVASVVETPAVDPFTVEKPVEKKVVRKGRIMVTAKYQMEDRYVAYGGIEIPDYRGNQEGVVIVNISVSYSGDVKKTSINPATTITDADVLESARKAALKTGFNYNSDAPKLQSGTITYTFKRN